MASSGIPCFLIRTPQSSDSRITLFPAPHTTSRKEAVADAKLFSQKSAPCVLEPGSKPRNFGGVGGSCHRFRSCGAWGVEGLESPRQELVEFGQGTSNP